MATITGFLNRQVEKNYLNGQAVYSENQLDFSVINVLSTDLVQALKIPANALVDKVWVYVSTAEGATATATIGDEATADGWDASVNFNSTGINYTLEATDTYGAGKLYTSADTIDIDPGHDLDAAVVTVIARYTVLENV